MTKKTPIDQSGLDDMNNAALPDGSTYTGKAKKIIKDGQEVMVQHGNGT